MERRRTPVDRHVRRAFTHLEKKRLPEARAEVLRALTLEPEHIGAACALAQIEVAEGNPARAIDRLKQRIAAEPSSEDLLWTLSRILVDTGAVPAAVALLEDAAKANPDAAWPLEELARVHHTSAKDPARAIAAVDQALDRAKRAGAPDTFGLLHRLDAILDEAISADQFALADQGLTVRAKHTSSGAALLACFRALAGKAPLPDALIALASRPRSDTLDETAAIALRLAERIARAYEANGSDTALALAFLACDLVRYDDYKGTLAPMTARLRRRLRERDFDILKSANRALCTFYQRRVRAAPEDALAWAGLAERLGDMADRDDDALAAALRAVALAPADREIADVAVRLLAQQKRVPEAFAVADRYAAIEPKDPWLWERVGGAAQLYARDINAAIKAYTSAADIGSASAARKLIELAKEHGRWDHYVDSEQQRLTALVKRDDDDDHIDAGGDDDDDDDDDESRLDGSPEAPAREDADEPVEGEPPAGEPSVPRGLVLRPRFLTVFGPFEAGKAFAVRLTPDGPPLIVTTQHLFGPAGGAPRVIDADKMPSSVSGVELTDAFDGSAVCTGGAALLVPYASAREERADIAAFRVTAHHREAPALLADDGPRYGDAVWLASPVRAGAPEGQELHRGEVTDYDDDLFCFRLDNGGLELGGTSGAPILDRRGRVLGVHVRYERSYDGLVGRAIAAPALRGFLCDALDPERLLGDSMSHRRHISMSIHVKTLATLTLRQAESVVSGVDRDTGELCHLLGSGPLEIALTYPLEKPHVVSVAGDKEGDRPVWLGGVLWHIAKGYEEVYRDPAAHGVWGHDLSDLYLEGLIIDGDKAEILVGS